MMAQATLLRIDEGPFAPVRNGATAFADVDGDGSQDLLLTGLWFGLEGYEAIAKLYMNDGRRQFYRSYRNTFSSGL